MSIVQLQHKKSNQVKSIWSEPHRLFFFVGSLYSIISIFCWILIYSFKYNFSSKLLNTFQWHAHEMIFGYTMSVIAGFLLTAVPHWTGVIITNSKYNILLLTLWTVARIGFFIDDSLIIPFVSDLLFCFFLNTLLLSSIIKSKKWKNFGIISKLFILTIINILFYYYCFNGLSYQNSIALHTAVYTIIGLIITITGRVLPGFILNTLNIQKSVPSSRVVIINLLLVITFVINQIFFKNTLLLRVTSFGISAVLAYRLILIHNFRIWKKPLLWGLFISNFFILMGFISYLLCSYNLISEYIAIHFFTYGGIGLSTLSMMPRVLLGHSGGDVNNPPNSTKYFLSIMCLGLLFRTVVPIYESNGYIFWIFLSQILWCLAFAIFIVSYRKYFLSNPD